MNVKVFIEDGVIVGMLSDSFRPLNVEVTYIDKDSNDYEAANNYMQSIVTNDRFRSINCETKDFGIL